MKWGSSGDQHAEKHLSEQLNAWLTKIVSPDQATYDEAMSYIDTLTKPKGSLGKLEKLAAKLASIRGRQQPVVHPAAVVVMAADHGIARAGVSAYPQEVTAQMVLNFLQGGAAINVFARQIGAEVTVVDMGVASDVERLWAEATSSQKSSQFDASQLLIRKVRNGTANMLEERAMSRVEALQAILSGIEIAESTIGRGAACLIPGEMGIGNTTSSSAIVAVLGQRSVDEVTGTGTGVMGDQLTRKREIIQRVLDKQQPDASDAIDVLSKIGGLEVAGLTGLMLGAAAYRVPILLDGFICGAAALIARSLCPACVEYMIAGHQSQEPGHQIVLTLLEKKPLLQLALRLGEGSGAALAYPLLQAATHMVQEMATFESAGVTNKEE